MSNMDNLRTLYTGLTDGEKIYLANKLFKEDNIVAQKVLKYIPPETMQEKPQTKFKKGQTVWLKVQVAEAGIDENGQQEYRVVHDNWPVWCDDNALKGETE